MIVLQATWTELEGGPDEHHRGLDVHQRHLAEPAETSSLRGAKRRAKADRTDARLLRELLEQNRLTRAD
jgi:hypothetical protein